MDGLTTRGLSNLAWLVSKICFTSLLTLSLGCGASRQNTNYNDDSIDMDELLGDESDTKSTEGESDEAEVLRLLGITPTQEQPAVEPVNAVKEEPIASDIEKDMHDLRQQLLDRDRQISVLRAELTQKESQISDLKVKSATARNIPPGKAGEPSREFRAAYNQALSQFKARNYTDALATFSQLIQRDPNNSLSDNCQYWAGECRYAVGSYNQAITEFERVFSYPNSNKSDDSQVMIGLCYLKLGETSQARTAFNQLLVNYPKSEYRGLAQRYISN